MVLGIFNKLVHWASKPRDDKVGLGCWCWAMLQGKNNITIRVVSVYQPCYSYRPQLTYQQLRHPNHQLPACPRARFMVELMEAIRAWLQDREQLVIMSDFNNDTTQGVFK